MLSGDQLLTHRAVPKGRRSGRVAWAETSRGGGWVPVAGHLSWRGTRKKEVGRLAPMRQRLQDHPCARRALKRRTAVAAAAAAAFADGCISPRLYGRAWHTTDPTSCSCSSQGGSFLAEMQRGGQVLQKVSL